MPVAQCNPVPYSENREIISLEKTMKKLVIAAALVGFASTASATGILPVQDAQPTVVVGTQPQGASLGLIVGGLVLGGLLLTQAESSDGTN